MIVVRYGADHPDLGTAVDAELDERAAVALSRGRFRKGYASVDANEDAVLAAAGPAGHVLAVADGHNGAEASHAALGAVADGAEAVLADTRVHADAVEALFAAAIAAVREAVADLPPPRDRSRTALTVAVVAPGAVLVGTLGDTVAAVVRGGRTRPLGEPSGFLGPRSAVPAVNRARLRADDVVAVASDGMTDYVGAEWPDLLARLATEAASARETARRLVDAAMAGGAGDNIAVAVADARPPERPWRRWRRGAP